MPACRARAKRSASSAASRRGQDQEVADVQHARRRLEHGVEVGGDEARVGADAVDEPPILAPDVDDQGLAGRQLGVDHERAGIDPARLERLGGEPAEDVVADAGADGRRDAQPGEVDRRVGGAAADVQDQLVDRDQLAGPRQVIDRRAEMVGHDEPAQTTGQAVEAVAVRVRHVVMVPDAGAAIRPIIDARARPDKTRRPSGRAQLGLSIEATISSSLASRQRAVHTAGALADQLFDLADGEDLAFDQGLGQPFELVAMLFEQADRRGRRPRGGCGRLPRR